jgi:hypothetical protein
MQAILPSLKHFEFSGLKLNRMGLIKSELLSHGFKVKECTFAVRFIIGSLYWDSAPFKIVSSFAQLPPDFQAQRPYKRGNSAVSSSATSTTSEEEEDASKRPKKVSKRQY